MVQGEEAPYAAFVEGDAGVGKTALLEAVVADTGGLVLWARPTAAEAASSYAAIMICSSRSSTGSTRCPRRSAGHCPLH